MTEIWVERRKWPSTPHYGHQAWILGEDDHGLWLDLRAGSPVFRGSELLFHFPGGGLMLVPPIDGWLAWFPESGEVDLYVDIVTGTTRTDSSITMVDLDLDVVRWRAGEVQLVDEDDFFQHQIELDYPAEIIEHAELMGSRVLNDARSNIEPFDGTVAMKWAELRRQ
jgi:uncharacterized protein